MNGLRPDDPAFDISDRDDVAALLLAEERHFWQRSRNRFIIARLARMAILPRARIVDLGCGAGSVAVALANAGYDLTGVDGHRELIEVARARAPSARFHCSDLRAGALDLPSSTFDVASLFDVIEHLDHPDHALELA